MRLPTHNHHILSYMSNRMSQSVQLAAGSTAKCVLWTVTMNLLEHRYLHVEGRKGTENLRFIEERIMEGGRV